MVAELVPYRWVKKSAWDWAKTGKLVAGVRCRVLTVKYDTQYNVGPVTYWLSIILFCKGHPVTSFDFIEFYGYIHKLLA